MYGFNVIHQEYFNMSDVAKIIDIRGYGKINLFKLLREKKVLNNCNQPEEKFITLGYFKPLVNIIPVHSRKIVKYGSCRVSKDGIDFIRALISESI